MHMSMLEKNKLYAAHAKYEADKYKESWKRELAYSTREIPLGKKIYDQIIGNLAPHALAHNFEFY